MASISFAFGSCGPWNMPYQIGAARCIKEMLPNNGSSNIRFVGTSGGSLPAALIAGDLGLQRARACLAHVRKKSKAHMLQSSSITDDLLLMLPDDAHHRVRDNLSIAHRSELSNVSDMSPFDFSGRSIEMKTEFESLSSLKTAIRTSSQEADVLEIIWSQLPFFGASTQSNRTPFGGTIPKLDANSITISPHPFAADISPQIPLASSVFAPSVEEMRSMENLGYRDCKAYLSQHREVVSYRMEGILPHPGLGPLSNVCGASKFVFEQ